MGIPIVVATNGYGTPITEAANGYGTPVEIATNGYGLPVVIVASGGLPVVGSGGGASIYAPESETIFASFTTPPTTQRKQLIDDCVRALKTAGVWAKLDVLHVMAAADSQAAKVNWKAPGTYNATEVNAPAFAADQGYTGASSKYLDTGFNAFTAVGPQFVQNSATSFAWSNTNGWQQNASIVGYSPGSFPAGNQRILTMAFNGNTYLDINDNSNDFFTPGSGLGLFALTRRSSTAKEAYRNGASLGALSFTSSAPYNEVIKYLQAQGQAWTGQIAAGGFGSQLSTAEHTALYNALSAYLAGIAGYAAESGLIFNAFTTPPTAPRKTVIDTYVKALKSAGVWDKLDTLYAFAAADRQAGIVNWKQPGVYNSTEVNAPTFTADRGFTSNGTTNYLDCGFNASTAPSPKYTMNSACIFAHALTNIQHIGGVIADGAGMALITPRYTDDNFYLRTNENTGNLSGASTNGIGFWSATRSGATTSEAFKNGVSVDTDATAAATLPTTMYFLRYVATYWPGQVACGGFGQHLTAADNTALYNATSAYLTSVGALSSYQAETNAIAAAFTTPPTTARKDAIDAAVVALKAAGVWTKLDALYAFAAADSQAAKINWKNPGTFNATEVNAPTFTADRGFTGNGTTNYLDTGFNPASAPSPNFVLNSATLFGWSLTNVDNAGGVVGSLDALNNAYLVPRTTNLVGWRINSTGTFEQAANSDSTGLFSVSRTGASASSIYRNGASLGTGVSASTAVTNGAVVFLIRYGAYWPGQVAIGGVGSSLNSTEQTALYNALNGYLATIKIVSAFTTPPTQARQALIQNCVTSLMTAGVWDKLDALYAFAAADSQAALINWKAPGTFNGTLVNAPTFTADSGFTGGSTKYIDTGFNPTTAPTPKFTQNDATIFAQGTVTTPGNGGIFGNNAAGTESWIYPRYGGTNFNMGINQGSDTGIANSDGNAFFAGSRTASNAISTYKNGVFQVTGAQTSNVPFNSTHQILRRATDYYLYSVPVAGFGSQLNATEHTALYNALRAYMTGVGVP